MKGMLSIYSMIEEKKGSVIYVFQYHTAHEQAKFKAREKEELICILGRLVQIFILKLKLSLYK